MPRNWGERTCGLTCDLRSLSSNDENANCNAQCSSRRHVFNNLSSCNDVVSITISARKLVFIDTCSAMLEMRCQNYHNCTQRLFRNASINHTLSLVRQALSSVSLISSSDRLSFVHFPPCVYVVQ